MTAEKKSVISARDIAGVVAKLNTQLNRSADRSLDELQAEVDELKNGAAKPTSVRAIARKIGIRRATVKSVIGERTGTYIFRLLAKDVDTDRKYLGIVRCTAQNEQTARINLADRLFGIRVAEVGRSVLLRYQPMTIEEFVKFDGLVDLRKSKFDVPVEAAA